MTDDAYRKRGGYGSGPIPAVPPLPPTPAAPPGAQHADTLAPVREVR